MKIMNGEVHRHRSRGWQQKKMYKKQEDAGDRTEKKLCDW